MNENPYLLPDKVYDVLKWVSIILCPALAFFVGLILNEFGIPWEGTVVRIINGFGVFVGALIGASQLSAIGGK